MVAQRGDQKIAPSFNFRDAFLSNAQRLGDLLLGKPACLPQLPQSHFLGNELGGTGLYLFPLSRGKAADNVVYISWHGYFLSCGCSRFRCASKRLSAFVMSCL